ncbi:MAG: hypothetical protein M3N98_03315 [Actinomycetota bacterium]|nr:hypothetical protein [Actinomycetota bacterium]
MSTITHGDADASLAEVISLLRRAAATVDRWCNEPREFVARSLDVNLLEASYCVHRALSALHDVDSA